MLSIRAAFDPQAKLVFFSCSEGVLNIFHEKSANDYEDAGPVKTQPSARTMAFDPKTTKIFLSAAEYVETPASTPGGRRSAASSLARSLCWL